MPLVKYTSHERYEIISCAMMNYRALKSSPCGHTIVVGS